MEIQCDDTASMFTDYSVRGNMMNLEKTGYLRYACICYFMPFLGAGKEKPE